MKRSFSRLAFAGSICLAVLSALGADWPRFRGPNGASVSDEKNLPVEWGPEKNIVWKTALPGWGTSSPITSGDKVFVTCFSGYGLGDGGQGDQAKLKGCVPVLRS